MSASPELNLVPILRPILTSRSADDHGMIPPTSRINSDKEAEAEQCQTPTSEESRLPTIPKSCPPAPRKPRPAVRCKRRLSVEFFEVGAEEIERLFNRIDRPHITSSITVSHRVKKARLSSS